MTVAARRVLLTGATGFIGRHAIRPLLERGYDVHAVSRARHVPGAISHVADLREPNEVRRLMLEVRPTHLLHLAWDVTPGKFWSAAENLDWVAASLHLYRAFAAAGGRRCVVAGTCAEYKWAPGCMDGDLEEDVTPLFPTTVYGCAKHALNILLSAMAASDGLEFAWGRIFHLYGPHEPEGRFIPDVVLPLLRGQPAHIGTGTALRDFMHVQDVAGALAAVLDSPQTGALNIATGTCHSVREVAAHVAVLIGRPDLVRFGARMPPRDEPARLAAATRRLQDGVGFRPRFSLTAGLANTVDWWRGEEAVLF